jgi:hypothetical protein
MEKKKQIDAVNLRDSANLSQNKDILKTNYQPQKTM